MLEQIKVVTDSSADLPTHLLEELGIVVIPLIVNFGAQSYEDTALSHEEFWRLARGPVKPTTSQPSSGAFYQTFQRWVDQGYRVLCATVTGCHSGTFDTARNAASAFGDRVTVVDSRSLSWGLGWQVIQAVKMATQGANIEKILDGLRNLRERTHIIIQLDTVEYLRRGGRAAKLMPVIERLMRSLDLKPLITLVDGELKLLGVARSYRKGIARIQEEILRLGPLERLAIMHTRRHEIAERFADELAKLTKLAREQIIVAETGAVLSCHGGDGIIAAVAVAAQ